MAEFTIPNESIVRFTVNQGTEEQRRASHRAAFLIGELAFTRDTQRLFVGNFTAADGVQVTRGGSLTGNKLLKPMDPSIHSVEELLEAVASGARVEWNHDSSASYREGSNSYDGDYCYVPSDNALVLLHGEAEGGAAVFRAVEPDGVTVRFKPDTPGRNVLEVVSVKPELMVEVFSEDFTVRDNLICVAPSLPNLAEVGSAAGRLRVPAAVTVGSTDFRLVDDARGWDRTAVFRENAESGEYEWTLAPLGDVIRGDGNVVYDGGEIRLAPALEGIASINAAGGALTIPSSITLRGFGQVDVKGGAAVAGREYDLALRCTGRTAAGDAFTGNLRERTSFSDDFVRNGSTVSLSARVAGVSELAPAGSLKVSPTLKLGTLDTARSEWIVSAVADGTGWRLGKVQASSVGGGFYTDDPNFTWTGSKLYLNAELTGISSISSPASLSLPAGIDAGPVRLRFTDAPGGPATHGLSLRLTGDGSFEAFADDGAGGGARDPFTSPFDPGEQIAWCYSGSAYYDAGGNLVESRRWDAATATAHAREISMFRGGNASVNHLAEPYPVAWSAYDLTGISGNDSHVTVAMEFALRPYLHCRRKAVGSSAVGSQNAYTAQKLTSVKPASTAELYDGTGAYLGRAIAAEEGANRGYLDLYWDRILSVRGKNCCRNHLGNDRYASIDIEEYESDPARYDSEYDTIYKSAACNHLPYAGGRQDGKTYARVFTEKVEIELDGEFELKATSFGGLRTLCRYDDTPDEDTGETVPHDEQLYELSEPSAAVACAGEDVIGAILYVKMQAQTVTTEEEEGRTYRRVETKYTSADDSATGEPGAFLLPASYASSKLDVVEPIEAGGRKWRISNPSAPVADSDKIKAFAVVTRERRETLEPEQGPDGTVDLQDIIPFLSAVRVQGGDYIPLPGRYAYADARHGASLLFDYAERLGPTAGWAAVQTRVGGPEGEAVTVLVPPGGTLEDAAYPVESTIHFDPSDLSASPLTADRSMEFDAYAKDGSGVERADETHTVALLDDTGAVIYHRPADVAFEPLDGHSRKSAFWKTPAAAVRESGTWSMTLRFNGLKAARAVSAQAVARCDNRYKATIPQAFPFLAGAEAPRTGGDAAVPAACESITSTAETREYAVAHAYACDTDFKAFAYSARVRETSALPGLVDNAVLSLDSSQAPVRGLLDESEPAESRLVVPAHAQSLIIEVWQGADVSFGLFTAASWGDLKRPSFDNSRVAWFAADPLGNEARANFKDGAAVRSARMRKGDAVPAKGGRHVPAVPEFIPRDDCEDALQPGGRETALVAGRSGRWTVEAPIVGGTVNLRFTCNSDRFNLAACIVGYRT